MLKTGKTLGTRLTTFGKNGIINFAMTLKKYSFSFAAVLLACVQTPPPLKKPDSVRGGGVCNQATVRLGLSFLLQFFWSDKCPMLTTSSPYVVRSAF